MEKKYNQTESEKKIQNRWQEERIYAFDPNAGPLYSIDTPPPTVSGALHIGHIFSYTQTDILARYKRLDGHAVFYPFGFDDNGLPTERFVEKKLKITAHSMGRSDFINLCLKETVEVEEEFKSLWQNMGLSVDWDRAYTTISPESRKISQESFILLYKKGYIYRRYEPALYCTTCFTSVAQAELDDIEKTSFFTDIVFRYAPHSRQAFHDAKDKELIISTTRPELLPSCVALFYHPDDNRYKKLDGKKAIVPIFGHEVPILPDDTVDPEKGTGLVMCCTFGDKNDILWFKKHNLPYRESINKGGRWTKDTGILAGMKAHEARKTILQELENNNLIKAQKETTRPVNVHERCKKEIEYIALSQWFLKILPYKDTFIKQAEKINWYPSYMKSRYINWVENISWDWCLSRQRFYGIPFPVWHCSNGHVLLAPIEDLPIDPQETSYPGKCPECGSNDITPETDVMDTWNTSSLTPQICFSLFDVEKRSPFDKDAIEEFIPMGMRPQAHDIIRTWAFYTIVKAWMHYDDIPWKNIVISGHVLSDGKEKLSKSKENTKIAPGNLLKNYSADVIRYWTASGRLGQDIAFSENQLKIGQRLVTKLWNAFFFVHEHIKDAPTSQPKELGIVNEWLLNQLSQTFTQYKKYLDENEFSLALDTIEQFFWQNFCDNYLELIKDQLFKPEKYVKKEIEATRWTLSTVGFSLLQLYAPYLPFVTEELYLEIYKKIHQEKSIHLSRFINIKFEFKKSADAMEPAIDLIAQVRKLKTEKQLSLKVPLKELIVYAKNDAILQELKPLEQIVKGITQTQTVSYEKGEAGSILKQENELWHATITITS